MRFLDSFINYVKHIKRKLVIMIRGSKYTDEERKQLIALYKKSPIEAEEIIDELIGKEPSLIDEIHRFLRMDFTKENSFKFFRKLFQILNKMEEKNLYDFIKKEVYSKWKREELLSTIKKLEESKEKFRDLKLNILKSRKHITLKKEDYWNTLPLIRYTEVTNRPFKRLGISLDAFYLKTISCLILEIDKFFSSWVAKKQR